MITRSQAKVRPQAAYALTVGALATIVSLPFHMDPAPQAGLDPSWHLGLSLAHVQDLAFGSELVFTFGPLGFLSYPDSTFAAGAMLSLLYAASTGLVLYTSFFHAARRWLCPWMAAALTAWFSFTAMLVGTTELAGIALLLVGAALVAPSAISSTLTVWIPILLGGLSGMHMLVKFSTGMYFVTASAVIVTARSPRGRNLALFAATSALTLLGLWLATGQRLLQLDDWLVSSARIGAGYTSAMATVGAPLERALAAGTVVAVACAVIGVAFHGRRAPLAVAALPQVALFGLTAFFFIKAGVVRLDPGHLRITQVAALALTVAVPWVASQRTLALIAGLLLGMTPLLITGRPVPSAVRSVTQLHARSIENAAIVIVGAVSSAERSEQLEAARNKILHHYKIGDRAAALPADLHAEPWDVAAVWALDRRWNPPPAFQAYTAYTAELDRRNAEHFRGERGPSAILYNGETIDGRFHPWESPSAQVAMTCSYAKGAQIGSFLVLSRVGELCDTPLQVASATVPASRSIRVPRLGTTQAILAARFDYPTRPLHGALSLVLKPTILDEVVIDGATHRFLTGTSKNLHLLRVPASFGDIEMHNGGLEIDDLSFPDAGGDVEVTFFEIPLAMRGPPKG